MHSQAARRCDAALDRIASALVRRAEADAGLRDRADDAQHDGAHGVDAATVDELRARLDDAIGRLRAALGS